MRIFCCLMLAFSLIACDGLDLDQIDSEDKGIVFSSGEFQNKMLFSSLLLSSVNVGNNLDGFIALFNASNKVEQIKLDTDESEKSVVGEYTWGIESNALKVTYQSNYTCTSTKNTETTLQYTVTTVCENPNNATLLNDRISGTLIKPLSFSVDNLTNRVLEISVPSSIEGDPNIIEDIVFDVTNGFTEAVDSNTTVSGIFVASSYENIVELKLPDATNTTERRLYTLINGDIETGRVLELRYKTVDVGGTPTESLDSIRVYQADNNKWEVISHYTAFTLDI